MKIHPLAGKPAPQGFLVDVDKLRKEYYARKPDVTDNAQRVNFGTSGHRGSSLLVCEFRSCTAARGFPRYGLSSSRLP